MPRQDVPYGGALCRLRERIAEIWDKLGEKLHSINGVEGDGAGDVKIVSGDAAVVITSNQVNHEIGIALDSSQLPAAAVASVNGQTGAVALDAGDIPSDGNSDVQTDIDVNKAAISACSSAITSEQLARQNADSTLQTNINTVSAGIPAAAAAAVAADPTVAQLVVDLGDKIDVSNVSTVETPDTIAKRNGSGRLVAADPASGATDKTLVTANWVSQTGDAGPNNLIHKSGNETKNGTLTLNNGFKAYPFDWHETNKSGQAVGEYCIFAEIGTNYNGRYLVIDFVQGSNTATVYGRLMLKCNKSAPAPIWAYRKTNGSNNPLSSTAIHVISDGSKLYLAWKKEQAYGVVVACEILDINYGTTSTLANSNITWYDANNRVIVADLSAYTDYQVVE